MNMSDRIRARMRDLNYEKAVEVSRASKGYEPTISPVNINQWLCGKGTPSAKKLSTLSKVLKTDDDWLLYGISTSDSKTVDEPTSNYALNRVSCYPLIGWNDVVRWNSSMDKKDITAIGEYRTYEVFSKDCFSLKVESENMKPDLMVGELALIDPTEKPKNNDFILVTINGSPTFRQITFDADQKFIKSTNPDWPNRISPLDETISILGVVVEKWQKFR